MITDIINGRDINYNELELESLMDKIENLRNIYNTYKNRLNLKIKIIQEIIYFGIYSVNITIF